MPLVYAGTREEEPITDAHESAEDPPQYARGELVKVTGGRNLADSEMIQGILLDQGIPSVLRRTRGFDVPDFLAAGPRDVLVPESGYQRRGVLRATAARGAAELLTAEAGPRIAARDRLPGLPSGEAPGGAAQVALGSPRQAPLLGDAANRRFDHSPDGYQSNSKSAGTSRPRSTRGRVVRSTTRCAGPPRGASGRASPIAERGAEPLGLPVDDLVELFAPGPLDLAERRRRRGQGCCRAPRGAAGRPAARTPAGRRDGRAGRRSCRRGSPRRGGRREARALPLAQAGDHRRRGRARSAW